MDEITRRKLERGKRALAFCRAHPDPNPGYRAVVARLEALLARAEAMQRQETDGGDPSVKIIPIEQWFTRDPTDPAA